MPYLVAYNNIISITAQPTKTTNSDASVGVPGERKHELRHLSNVILARHAFY